MTQKIETDEKKDDKITKLIRLGLDNAHQMFREQTINQFRIFLFILLNNDGIADRRIQPMS